MARQSWNELIAWAKTSGTAIASSTTETIIFPDVPLPANYLQDSKVLRLRAFGEYSNTSTPTLIFAVRFGGVAGTILCKTAAITTPSGVTSCGWDVDVIIQTRTEGATGTIMANGVCRVFAGVAPTVASSTGNAAVTPMMAGGTTLPATATVDTTAAANLSLTAKWSASSASNTLTGLNFLLESVN